MKANESINKVCPLFSMSQSQSFVGCLGTLCAWWNAIDDENGECGIVCPQMGVIAEQLSHIVHRLGGL